MVVHAYKMFFRTARQKKAEEALAAERALVAERLEGIAKSAAASSDADGNTLPERRDDERQSVYLQAQLITEGLNCIHCNVVDLSADGARVVLAGDDDVTRFVTLQYERSGITKKARVAWRHKNELGLAFRADEKTSEDDQEQAPAA